MPYTYEYPRPMVTVDILLLRIREESLQLLLIQRGHPPFEGKWALPGGYVEIEEPILSAAQRELKEETDIENIPLWEMGVVGTPGRDPRGRTITILHLGVVPLDLEISEKAGDDARLARWFPIDSLPPTAFDHQDIIANTLQKFRFNFLFRFWCLLFMPEPRFSLSQLARVFKIVLNQEFPPTTLISLFSKFDGLQYDFSTKRFLFTRSKKEVVRRDYDDYLQFWLKKLSIFKEG